MAKHIQMRRDTAANWEHHNPVLMQGEMGIVTDDPNLYKVGDGTTAWNSLPYRGYNGTIAQGPGENENAVMSQKATTHLVSVSQNNQTGHTEIHIGGNDYPVASVDDIDNSNYNAGFQLVFSADNTKSSYLIDSTSPNYAIVSATGEKGVISNFIPLGKNCYALILKGLAYKRQGALRFSEAPTDNGIAYKYELPYQSGHYDWNKDYVIIIPNNLSFNVNYVTVLVNRLDNSDSAVYGGSIEVLTKAQYDEYILRSNLIDVNVFDKGKVKIGYGCTDAKTVYPLSGHACTDFIKIPSIAKYLSYNGLLASDTIRAIFCKYPLDDSTFDRAVIELNQKGHGLIDLSVYTDYNSVALTVFRGASGETPSNLDSIDIRFINEIEKTNAVQVFDANKIRANKSVSTSSPYPIVNVTRNQVLTHFIPIPSWAKSIKYDGILGAFDLLCRFSQYPKDDGAAISVPMIPSGKGEIDLTAIDTDTYHYFVMPVFLDVQDSTTDISKVSIVLSHEFAFEPNYAIEERFAWNNNPSLFVDKPKITFIIDGYGGDMDALRGIFKNAGVKASFIALPNQMDTISYSHNVMKSLQEGHEIMIHSDSNANLSDGSTMTEAQVRAVIVNYFNRFKLFGLPYPLGFITMNGKAKDEFKPIIEDYMSFAAMNPNIDAATYTGNYSDVTNVGATKYNFHRFCLDKLNTDDNIIINNAKSAIDICIENKGLIVFYCHGYGDASNYMSENTMNGIMSYIIEKMSAKLCICGRADEMFKLHFR